MRINYVRRQTVVQGIGREFMPVPASSLGRKPVEHEELVALGPASGLVQILSRHVGLSHIQTDPARAKTPGVLLYRLQQCRGHTCPTPSLCHGEVIEDEHACKCCGRVVWIELRHAHGLFVKEGQEDNRFAMIEPLAQERTACLETCQVTQSYVTVTGAWSENFSPL